MLRMMLVMNDGNAFTIRHQQHQTQILERLKSRKGFYRFLLYLKQLNNYNYEEGNLEIHHSDDNRHSDGYCNQPGSHILHGLRSNQLLIGGDEKMKK